MKTQTTRSPWAKCRTLAVVLWVATAWGRAATVEVRDDFSAAVPGRWEADEFNWAVRGGRLAADIGLSTRACLAGEWLYRTATVEATLVLDQAVGKQWKVAGVSLYTDDTAHWHLALVESPETEGKRHFVELCEMFQGKWLSQTSLKRTVNEGSDFAWQYGTPYRLRLELSPKGIDGKVLTSTGVRAAHIAYEFTADAVKEGRPALRIAGFTGSFDDVVVTADDTDALPLPKTEEKGFAPYAVPGSGVKAAIPANGFFQVEKEGERWWLVDPRGERFYAVGTDHVNYNSHWCQKLGYAPYHRNCETLYGSVTKWAETATQRLRDWGFNLLGAGNIAEVRYQGLAHTLFISFGSQFSDFSALVEKTTWTGFPNVFDPRWEKYCGMRAQQACAANRTDPWVLGYFLDNELEWYGKAHKPDGIWIETMKLPAGHSGKQAVVDHLKAHYATVAEFNAAWRQQAAAWDDVLKMTELAPPDEAARAVQTAWLGQVAERYFAVAAAAIRKADPNHLVIGSRFAGNAPEWAWKACARHCDVVTFNHYPRIDFEGGDLSSLAAVFETYYGLVDKPMMITEWSFPALDSGLPCQHGAGMRVDTQTQKTKCFEVMQHLLFRLPFMVGSDYFMWADEPELGISDTFPEDSNYGLVNVDDKPYPELTAMAARLNPLALRLHAGGIPEVYLTGFAAGAEGLQVTALNRGSAEATVGIRIVAGTDTLSAPRLTLAPGSVGTVRVGGGTLPASARLTAEIVPAAAWVPRGCRGVTRRTAYVPPAGGAGVQVVLANDGAEALPSLPVQVALAADTAGPVHLATADSGKLPLLAFGDGTWVLQAPPLAGNAMLAGRVLPGAAAPADAVRVEKLGDKGYVIDNGRLRLEHDGVSGNTVDRISLQGVLLGSYNPLVWQRPGGDNQWVPASELAGVDIQPTAAGVVLTVASRHADQGGVITAVDDQGKMAARQKQAVPFEVTHRLVVFPGLPFILARCVAVRNLDAERPLTLMGAFHYLRSSLGGSPDGDTTGLGRSVPNYYRTVGSASWYDTGVGARYGCAPLDRRIQAYFWLDSGGTQHPDARLVLENPVELAPGKEYRPEGQPALLVYGALEKTEGPAAWSAVQTAIDGLASLRVVVPGAADTER